jgi:hypothetical protein
MWKTLPFLWRHLLKIALAGNARIRNYFGLLFFIVLIPGEGTELEF